MANPKAHQNTTIIRDKAGRLLYAEPSTDRQFGFGIDEVILDADRLGIDLSNVDAETGVRLVIDEDPHYAHDYHARPSGVTTRELTVDGSEYTVFTPVTDGPAVVVELKTPAQEGWERASKHLRPRELTAMRVPGEVESYTVRDRDGTTRYEIRADSPSARMGGFAAAGAAGAYLGDVDPIRGVRRSSRIHDQAHDGQELVVEHDLAGNVYEYSADGNDTALSVRTPSALAYEATKIRLAEVNRQLGDPAFAVAERTIAAMQEKARLAHERANADNSFTFSRRELRQRREETERATQQSRVLAQRIQDGHVELQRLQIEREGVGAYMPSLIPHEVEQHAIELREQRRALALELSSYKKDAVDEEIALEQQWLSTELGPVPPAATVERGVWMHAARHVASHRLSRGVTNPTDSGKALDLGIGVTINAAREALALLGDRDHSSLQYSFGPGR